MGNKDQLVAGLALVSGILILVMIENQRQIKIQSKQIQELKRDRLKLIQESLKKSNLSEEVKAQVQKLIDEYKAIDEDITSELISILSLIEIGQSEKAIKDLAKIIENILTDRFKKAEKFKKYRNYIPLAKLIDYAFEINLFNKKEYNASCILREFRNEESHKLNVKYGVNWQIIGLLGGLEIIFKLKGELSIEPEKFNGV